MLYKFRRINLLTVILISLFSIANAQQNIPNPTISTVNSATGINSPYNPFPNGYGTNLGVNYTRVWIPQKPMTLESDVIDDSKDVSDVHKTTEYTDGLGRKIQTVSWRISPSKNDMISPQTYDEFGQQSYNYLPYTASSTDGSLQLNPFSDQRSFYSNIYPSQQSTFAGEQFFYSKTIFESSPFNRPIKTFTPGNNWVGSEGGGSEHSVGYQYLNSGSNEVWYWKVDYNNDINANIPYVASYYEYGQLNKSVIVDTHGKYVVTYSDNQGHVVLKKTQVADNISPDFSGQDSKWLCTYYVYDYFGLLRFIIPPKAIAQLNNSGSNRLSGAIVNELCSHYEYDEKHRLTAQKIPGKGWEYMIYDIRDRLVFYQDAKLSAANQWLYNLYDDLDRVTQTGVMNYNSTRENLQISVNGNWQGQFIGQPSVNGSGIASIPADLTLDTRVPGLNSNDYKATNQITIDDGFVSENNAEFVAEIVSSNPSNFSTVTFGYNNPIPSGATVIPLSVTYYDDYSWTNKVFNTNSSGLLDIGNNSYGDPYPLQQEPLTAGKPTGSRIRVLENPSDITQGAWLETVVFYDSYGRCIQKQVDNYKGGVDIISNRYNFTGDVVSSYTLHNNPAANASLGVKTNYNYDFAGRLVDIRKKVSDNNNLSINYPVRIVASYQYDAMGRVLSKALGGQPELGNPSNQPLETLNYNFNINGTLKSVNKDFCTTPGNSSHYFGFDLSYDWGFSDNRFDGSISGMKWKSKGSGGIERAYGFGYDYADRFIKADFTQKDKNGNWNTSDGVDYSVKLGNEQTGIPAYDENGNIKALRQYGLALSGSNLIDDLTYQYDVNNTNVGNQLSNVSDQINVNSSLGDFTKKNISGSNDYSYDANGNLTQDNNKKISSINYNYLDLPNTISVNNDDNTPKSFTTYIYDASGNKLEKRVQIFNNNASQTKTVYTTYLGDFLYKDNVLQYFNHEEGRVRLTIPPVGSNSTTCGFAFDYFISDHLTNVRTILTDEQFNSQTYIATVEPQNQSAELQLFGDLLSQTEADKPSGFDNDNANTKVTKLVNYGAGNSSSQVEGPGVLLKVMAGDVVNISGYGWYQNPGASPDNNQSSNLVSIIAGLLGGTSGGIASEGHYAVSQVSGVLTQPVNSFIDPANRTVDPQRPKAYINWILLNEEQLKVQNSSGFVQVPQIAAGSQKQFMQGNSGSPITMSSNGYLYVFVTNESTTPVYFDNLRVDYKPGPLREENHYYPGGLQMNGISSRAFGAIINNRKYQGSYGEYEEETGYIEFKKRRNDPQLNRWTSVDPQHQFASGYESMGNNPVSNIDPDGCYTWGDALLNWAANGFRGFIGQQLSGVHYGEWYVSRISSAENEYLAGGGEGESDDVTVFNRKNFGESTGFHTPQLSQYEMGFFEKASRSNNLGTKILYGAANDIYITSQLFKNKYEKQNLGGGWANPNDAQKAFVRTASYAVPSLAGEAAAAENAASIMLEEEAAAKTGAESFFEDAQYSPKVLQQMTNAKDIVHSFPQSVDGFATKFGQWSTKVGADGKSYQWLEMGGSYSDKTGTFEFIKDANGVINHRYFNIFKIPQ